MIAGSSGNFGQALAFACRLHGKRCTIVMPTDVSAVKLAAVRAHGAEVDLVDIRTTPRAERVAALAAADPDAFVAYPSDGALMLAGNESLGEEILSHDRVFDAVVAPVGGGGVVVGLVRAAERLGHRARIVAAEPLAANDLAQSFRAGRVVSLSHVPETLADGVRTPRVSPENWAVIRRGCHEVIEVDEPGIAAATRLLFAVANLKAEPTGALALAAVLAQPARFAGGRVCCVVTGANVDPATYAGIILGRDSTGGDR